MNRLYSWRHRKSVFASWLAMFVGVMMVCATLPAPTAAVAAPIAEKNRQIEFVDALKIGAQRFMLLSVDTYDSSQPADGGDWHRTHTAELWVQAGPSQMARRIAEFPADGVNGPGAYELNSFDGKAFFFVHSMEAGAYSSTTALWRSDGTVAGTSEIMGKGNSEPWGISSLQMVGKNLVFVGQDESGWNRLWTWDPVAHKPKILSTSLDVRSENLKLNSQGNLAIIDSVGGSWWATDGTPNGTKELIKPRDGFETDGIESFGSVSLLGIRKSGGDKYTDEIWATEGTTTSTRRLQDGLAATVGHWRGAGAVGNDFYFVVNPATELVDSQIATAAIGSNVAAPYVDKGGIADDSIQQIKSLPGAKITLKNLDTGSVLGSATADEDGFAIIWLSARIAVGSSLSLVASHGGATSTPTIVKYDSTLPTPPAVQVTSSGNKTLIKGSAEPETVVTVLLESGEVLGTARTGSWDESTFTQFANFGSQASEFSLEVAQTLPKNTVLKVRYAGSYEPDTQLWCVPGKTGTPKKIALGTDARYEESLETPSSHYVTFDKRGPRDFVTSVRPSRISKADCAQGKLAEIGKLPTTTDVIGSAVSGNTLYFGAYTGPDGEGGSVWAETGGVLTKLRDEVESEFSAVASGVVFPAWNRSLGGMSLWHSNGTRSGTAIIQDLPDSEFGQLYYQIQNDRGFNGEFSADESWFTGTHRVGVGENSVMSSDGTLWVTDGTASGTQLVADVRMQSLKAFEKAPVPVVGGTLTVGSTLTANPGIWAPTGIALKYQWYRDGKAIGLATSSTYKLVAADAGKKMHVAVTGSMYGYAAETKTSIPTAAVANVLAATPIPTISGTLKVGSTLTANPGTWAPAGVTLKYQWYRDGKAIALATAPTYKLVTADAGAKVHVVAAGSKTGYVSVAKASASKSIAKMLFTSTPVPTISGTLKVGSLLTAKPGTWAPAGIALKYQWYRNGKAIGLATASTYKLVAADAGAKVHVVVTGSKTGYVSVAKASAGKSIAKLVFTSAPIPKVSGTMKVGSTLKAAAGTWKPAGVKLQYQWTRNGKPVKGATLSSYKIAKTDAGSRLRVIVTGSKAGYGTQAKQSALGAVVKK